MNVCGTQGTGQMILSKDMEESRVFLCELDQEGPGMLVCECVCVCGRVYLGLAAMSNLKND